MRGATYTIELDAQACRHRCQETPGCFHFSYWQVRGHCHLQDAFALRRENRIDFTSGPFQCWSEIPNANSFGRLGPQQFLPKELDCMQVGITWEPAMRWHPPQMFEGTQLDMIRQCQGVCARTPECEHFTMDVATDGCKLSMHDAVPLPGVLNTISGPPHCDSTAPFANFMQKKFSSRWAMPTSSYAAVVAVGLLLVLLVGMVSGAARLRGRMPLANERVIRLTIADDDDGCQPEE